MALNNKVPPSAKPKGKPRGGSRKGIPNKTTRTAKEAIAFAAAGLGGAERLITWAKEDPINERSFWSTIYPKLLPLQVANEDGEAFKTDNVWRVELVRANTDAT